MKAVTKRVCPRGMTKIGQTACRLFGKQPYLKQQARAGRDDAYTECYLKKKAKSPNIAVYCPKAIYVASKKKKTLPTTCLKTSAKKRPFLKLIPFGGKTGVEFCAVAAAKISKAKTKGSPKAIRRPIERPGRGGLTSTCA